MNALRKFHPDLHACELEDRLLPVTANPGVIVLTTGGFVLTAYGAGPTGSTAIPMSFSIAGSGGISGMQPGNSTGIPGLATTGMAGTTGSVGATNTIGLGANEATVATSTPLVTRDTIANDLLVPPPHIGRPSGDWSPILPVGQVYRNGVPEKAPARAWSKSPGGHSTGIPRPSRVDSTAIRLDGAPPRASSGVSGYSMKGLADSMP